MPIKKPAFSSLEILLAVFLLGILVSSFFGILFSLKEYRHNATLRNHALIASEENIEIIQHRIKNNNTNIQNGVYYLTQKNDQWIIDDTPTTDTPYERKIEITDTQYGKKIHSTVSWTAYPQRHLSLDFFSILAQ